MCFLSVCIITHNEERFLDNCLSSVKDIADEIIVVDAYSSDNTTEIAATHHAQIIQRPWNDDFSAARNMAIDHAKGNWVLFLDADETLQNGAALLDLLRKTMASDHEREIGGFLIERNNRYRLKENNKLTEYSVGIVRVFRNKSGFKYQYAIHEQIHYSILNKGFQIKVCTESRIVHHVAMSTNEELDRKQTYYLQLLTNELNNAPGDHWLMYHQAKTLWYFDRKSEAQSIFSKIKREHDEPKDLRVGSSNQCALIDLENQNPTSALNWIKSSKSLMSHQSMTCFIAYHVYYSMNLFEEAKAELLQVSTDLCNANTLSFIPGNLYCPRDIWHYKLGCAYLAMNKIDLAQTEFELGIEFNGDSSDNYYGLSIIALQKNLNKQAKQYIEKCLQQNPEWTEALELRALISQL